MDCSPPNSFFYGIFQARILEWVVNSSFRGSSRPRDQTCVSCIGRWIFTTEPPRRPCVFVKCMGLFECAAIWEDVEERLSSHLTDVGKIRRSDLIQGWGGPSWYPSCSLSIAHYLSRPGPLFFYYFLIFINLFGRTWSYSCGTWDLVPWLISGNLGLQWFEAGLQFPTRGWDGVLEIRRPSH